MTMKSRTAATASFLIAIAMTLTSCGGSSAGAQTSFSLASLKGSYAGIFSGRISTSMGPLPFQGTGIFVADGAGKLSGHESYTANGTACTATISGTYAVNADGSGTDSISFSSSDSGCVSGSYTQDLAIGQGGQLVLLSNSNADDITEEWHLQ
jgi:hypothetical protein